MPLPDFSTVATYIDKLSAVAVLAWGILAFSKGWIVPGSVYRAMVADRDAIQKRHDHMADIAEMVLRAKVGV
jgi:hypothetical protein